MAPGSEASRSLLKTAPLSSSPSSSLCSPSSSLSLSSSISSFVSSPTASPVSSSYPVSFQFDQPTSSSSSRASVLSAPCVSSLSVHSAGNAVAQFVSVFTFVLNHKVTSSMKNRFSSDSFGKSSWRSLYSAMSSSLLLSFLFLLVLSSLLTPIEALKRRSPLHSDVIEEVEAKRLEKLIQETDFIAVLFCKLL